MLLLCVCVRQVTTPFTERQPFRAADLWLRADHPQAGVTLLRALRMQQ